MKEEYEHEFLVFDVAEGPKVIIESLNSRGRDGWQISTMINVGTDKLCAFIQRRKIIEDPNPQKSAQSKIDSLWSGSDSDE